MNNTVYHIQWSDIWITSMGIAFIVILILYLITRYNRLK